MIDDWKEIHRGFQTHKNKKPPQQQQQQQQQPVTITQKDWDKIDAILGNDQIRSRRLMLAMSSCADEYDSERHLALDYGKDLASRWTSVRKLRAVESDEPVNYRRIGRLENIAREG